MLCLALGVLHPDYLVDVLSQDQIDGWHDYWKRKPFGHWIGTEMLATIAASNTTGKQADFIPRVEEVRELTDDELLAKMPGIGEAEQYLKQIREQHGNHQNT